MKKRLLSTLLALCMVVGLMPSIAYADQAPIAISEYEGNRVISEYIGYRNEDASGNNWSYDAATDTLTLNNFRGSIFALCSRVVLIGENTATHFMCYSATVEGSGSLTITVGIKGTFVLDSRLKMVGGTDYDDRMPLTMKDGEIIQPDGTRANFVRIEPNSSNSSSSNPTTTPTQPTEKPATSTGFTDVADNAWYREAVEYVSKPVYTGYDCGLMDSVTATEFSPNTNADRATIVTALCRRFNFDIEGNSKYDKAFSDVPDKLGAVVYWAVSTGVVTGYGGRHLRPI